MTKEGIVKEKNPKLFEVEPSGSIKEHICQLGEA